VPSTVDEARSRTVDQRNSGIRNQVMPGARIRWNGDDEVQAGQNRENPVMKMPSAVGSRWSWTTRC
jgi:hypothetical protein